LTDVTNERALADTGAGPAESYSRNGEVADSIENRKRSLSLKLELYLRLQRGWGNGQQ